MILTRRRAASAQFGIPDYLCFTALETGRFTLTVPTYVTTTYLSYIEWSKNGRTWTRWTNDDAGTTINVDVAASDKVYWRGSGQSMTPNHTAADRASRFSSTGGFDMSGHLLSLLKGSDYDNLSGIGNHTFCNLFYQSSVGLGVVHAHDLVMPPLNNTGMFFRLFRGCTSLLTAPALPQTSVPSWGFREMFYGCTSLTEIADMVATSYGNTCCLSMYYGCTSLTSATLPTPTTFSGNSQFQMMFRNCTSLTSAPQLLATTLAVGCYQEMFGGCTSLVIAPELPATTLVDNCYKWMFNGCTSLNYVKCLATDISATDCLLAWVANAASTGTFIQAEGVTWPSGASGIPSGWVTVEKRTMPTGYKQVEYVEKTTSTASYVDLGHFVDMKYGSFEIAYKQDEPTNGMVMQTMGSGNIDGHCRLYLYQNSSATSKPCRIHCKQTSESSSSEATVYAPLDDKPHQVSYDITNGAGNAYHFGTRVGGFSTTVISNLPDTCAYNTCLFGYSVPCECKIYYYKDWDKTATQTADYVACVRESDNVVGFYDFVSSTFKTASTASSLVAGPEI